MYVVYFKKDIGTMEDPETFSQVISCPEFSNGRSSGRWIRTHVENEFWELVVIPYNISL